MGIFCPGLYEAHVGHKLIKLHFALEDWELHSHSSDNVRVIFGARRELGLLLPAPAESCMFVLANHKLGAGRQTEAGISPFPCAKPDCHRAIVGKACTR